MTLAPNESAGLRGRLSNGIVGWYRERFGRGPTRCKAFVDDDHVLVILGDLESPVEKVLVENGQGELVLELRRTVRETFKSELCSLVQDALGRTVTTMLSDHDLERDTTTLVFLLERGPD